MRTANEKAPYDWGKQRNSTTYIKRHNKKILYIPSILLYTQQQQNTKQNKTKTKLKSKATIQKTKKKKKKENQAKTNEK